ncbi:MAG: hypothetical protein VX609_01610 [Verrucomicrobiota bacterium]|nr:hypothetical protein [Verrucomicrobiota bacterium]
MKLSLTNQNGDAIPMDCYPPRGVRATLLNAPPISLGSKGNIRCEFMFRFFYVEHSIDHNLCKAGVHRILYDSPPLISIWRTKMMGLKYPLQTFSDQFTDLNLFSSLRIHEVHKEISDSLKKAELTQFDMDDGNPQLVRNLRLSKPVTHGAYSQCYKAEIMCLIKEINEQSRKHFRLFSNAFMLGKSLFFRLLRLWRRILLIGKLFIHSLISSLIIQRVHCRALCSENNYSSGLPRDKQSLGRNLKLSVSIILHWGHRSILEFMQHLVPSNQFMKCC